MNRMRHYVFAAILIASPLAAQEDEGGLSLMEQGAQLFLKGLMSEIEPTIDELDGVLREMGPKLRDLAVAMGPRLQELLGSVDDWAHYEMPEILPNGDIIIRRKPDAPPLDTAQAPEEIEL